VPVAGWSADIGGKRPHLLHYGTIPPMSVLVRYSLNHLFLIVSSVESPRQSSGVRLMHAMKFVFYLFFLCVAGQCALAQNETRLGEICGLSQAWKES